MKNNVLQLQEIGSNSLFLGNKTLNLKKCTDWCFDVPKFVAIPAYVCSDLYSSEILKREIAEEAIRILQCEKYAVRSSALIEDNEKSSCAGQFKTKLNLSGDELVLGLEEVLNQANEFLHGKLDQFSIMIQEYIDADVSGVAFTRNPSGGREMVIEYDYCEGEKIVGGEVKPEKISFFWNESDINLPRQFSSNQIVEKFKDIENKSKSPQDIEWCMWKNKLYLLQTRPITTISIKQYEQIFFLENQLPKNEKYFFEKTEISEIAPRPTDFTLSLLRCIYSQNGPVHNVYKKYSVAFDDTDFLRIIGNELFVDKEKELQGLVPAYSYLSNKDFSPRINFYSKIIPTIRNLFFLNKIRTDGYQKIFHALEERLGKDSIARDIQAALDNFLLDYELIFETNLLSGLAVKKLNLLLKNETMNLPDILNGINFFIGPDKYEIALPQNLTGNSLDIYDESIFEPAKRAENISGEKISKWWESMSNFKKKMLQSKIEEAIIFNRLREYGRWLTIKNMTAIRNLLLNDAAKKRFESIEDIYFANMSDILEDKADEMTCKKRRKIHAQHDQYCLPSKITSSFIQKETEIMGVSAGVGGGVLQNREYLDSNECGQDKIILYTEMLSPSLTRYFDRISGIISENGGLLSHLAIMAREKNIPVITGFSLDNSSVKLGDSVEIDGSKGIISVIKERI